MGVASKFPLKITSAVLLLLAAFAWIVLDDLVFWDRYLRVYPFESYISNPFPETDRLYPQEVVKGAKSVHPISVAGEGNRTISAEALKMVDAFAEQMDSTSLIVYHNGQIQHERYWLGANRNRPVYSFSMHKSVVAMLVGIAIEEGYINSVDDRVSNYIPEWGGEQDARRDITIRYLLQMSSGLEPMIFPKNPFSKHVARQIGTNLENTALSFSLVKKPGETYSYSGANPIILVIMLERATGKRYAEYLADKLWNPVGNRDASVWLDKDNGLARGAIGLYATPRDWLRLGTMLLNRGKAEEQQILAPSWIDSMTKSAPTNPLYGFLTWIGTKVSEGRGVGAFTSSGFGVDLMEPFEEDLFYFSGLGGQRVYIIPSKNMVIVRTGVLSTQWEESFLPNTLIRGLANDRLLFDTSADEMASAIE